MDVTRYVDGNQADADAVFTGIPSGGRAKTSNSEEVELCTGGSLQVRLEPPGRSAGMTVIVKGALMRSRMMFVRVYPRLFQGRRRARHLRRKNWRRSSVGKFDRGDTLVTLWHYGRFSPVSLVACVTAHRSTKTGCCRPVWSACGANLPAPTPAIDR